MQNVQVTLANADSEKKEIEWVWYKCRRYAKQGYPAVVLIPARNILAKFIRIICDIEGASYPYYPNGILNNYYDLINQMLQDSGIPLQYLGNGVGNLIDSDKRPITYIMTYHSSKGLDFETVFLPLLNKDQTFWKNNENISRRLFFVGATRSRKNLFLSYSSTEPHHYVKAMPQNLLHKEICEVRQNNGADDDVFIF